MAAGLFRREINADSSPSGLKEIKTNKLAKTKQEAKFVGPEPVREVTTNPERKGDK